MRLRRNHQLQAGCATLATLAFATVLVAPAFALDDLGVVSGDTFELPGYNDGPSGGGVWPGSGGSGGDVGPMPLPNGSPDTGGSPHGGPGGGGGVGTGAGPKVDQTRPPYLAPFARLRDGAQAPFNVSNGECKSNQEQSSIVFDSLRPGEPLGPRPTLEQAERTIADLSLNVDIARTEDLMSGSWLEGEIRGPDAATWAVFRAAAVRLQGLLDKRNAAFEVWVDERLKPGAIEPAWCAARQKLGPATREQKFVRSRYRLLVSNNSSRLIASFALNDALLSFDKDPSKYPPDARAIWLALLNHYEFFLQDVYFRANRLHMQCCGETLDQVNDRTLQRVGKPGAP